MSSIILASASPQRKTLLEGLGLTFTVIPSQFNEDDHPEKNPPARAQVLALLKAQDVASTHPGAYVIGCDTLVVAHDGTLLEKPLNAEDARRMLLLHSGHTSIVHSGLTVIDPDGTIKQGISSSAVHFKQLSDSEVDWWITTGLWKDRSGGFQIDGQGQLMIERIEGDWSSIVGFPVHLFGVLAPHLAIVDARFAG